MKSQRGLESGISLKEMQEILGHASILMTGDIYGHVLPEQQRVAMNKLEGVFRT
jgi:integrase